MILKFYFVQSRFEYWGGVEASAVMIWWLVVWWETALPMSCYIVQETTTRCMSQSHAGYLRTSQSL